MSGAVLALDLGAIAATHPTALDGIERRIYADSVAAANNPTFAPDDRLIAIHKTGPGGHQITEFHGRHTFIWDMKRSSMRATGAWLTPSNRPAA